MSSVIPAMITRLLADATVSGAVGTRIYSEHAPQPLASTLPFIILSRVATARVHGLSASVGIAEVVVDLDIYTDTASERHTLAEAVRLQMDTYSGTMGSGSHEIDVSAMLLTNEDGDRIRPSDGSDLGVYRETMTFSVYHHETVPTPS